MRKLLRQRWIRLRWMMLLGLLLACGKCKPEEGHCVWLNEATASGYLNGPVTLDVKTGPEDQSICIFTNRKSAKDSVALRIMVQPLKDTNKVVTSHESLCASAPAPLKAIGNEAVSCSADVGHAHGEQVIGRVRDRLFIVSVTSTMAEDPVTTRQSLRESVRDIAEQVAGALF